MEEKIDLIMEELSVIKKKLELINEKLDQTEKNCSKMSEHIDFVDSVYEKIKYPLNCITKLNLK